MRIGILTSGGDCPGINATIRGVCKTAINYYGMEVVGIHSGFQGLLTKDVESFTDKSLSGLLNLGGTMLGTSREKPFKKGGVISDVDKPALILQNIREMGLDCVVCIGGNGTPAPFSHTRMSPLQEEMETEMVSTAKSPSV